MQRVLLNMYLAIEQVLLHRLRSVLTALGIVFGVGAVIAMLAIGAGAKQAIIAQMKLIGTNNILIQAKTMEPPDTRENATDYASTQNNKKLISKGLDISDMAAIKMIVPQLEAISPEVQITTNILRGSQLEPARVIGVNNTYFELHRFVLKAGQFFHSLHTQRGMPVCIISSGIQSRFFPRTSALGKKIKCGRVWLTIIGVLEQRLLTAELQAQLGIRHDEFEVYTPLQTALIRFENRARFAQQHRSSLANQAASASNYHQLDRLTVRIASSGKLRATAELLRSILLRRHQEVADVEIIVPELLLEQARHTQRTFNLVLATIASISLLVGGIGIMNIMLASVLERIPEIGLRRSLGAKQSDIQQQFIFEAIFICLIGGALGVGLGISSAELIAHSADIPTLVTGWSVLLSFLVASIVGLVFGIVPAQRAARHDPISALRSGL